MSTTFSVAMGDRGRLVIPSAVRQRQHWGHGTQLLLIETDRAVVVTTRAQAKEMVRAQLAGDSLVDQLLAERREQAHRDDIA